MVKTEIGRKSIRGPGFESEFLRQFRTVSRKQTLPVSSVNLLRCDPSGEKWGFDRRGSFSNESPDNPSINYITDCTEDNYKKWGNTDKVCLNQEDQLSRGVWTLTISTGGPLQRIDPICRKEGPLHKVPKLRREGKDSQEKISHNESLFKT